MTIGNLDQAAVGGRPSWFIAKAATPTLVVGRPHSFWAAAGSPGAGSYNGTLNGVVLESTSAQVNGAIPHVNPVSPALAELHRFSAQTAVGGKLLLLDRLWHNGGITITSTAAQNIVSPAWPSRCPTSFIDDTPATTGVGVYLAVEVSAATGAGTPTITISYTNSAGTAGRTATNVLATQATATAGAVYFIGLQAGDIGVRSVQSITLSATWTTGTINVVAYRLLTSVDVQPTAPGTVDFLTGGAPRLYDGVVPWMVWMPAATTAFTLIGEYQETHG